MNKDNFRFTLDIPIIKHQGLKILAAIKHKSMREIVLEGIDEQLKKIDEEKQVETNH